MGGWGSVPFPSQDSILESPNCTLLRSSNKVGAIWDKLKSDDGRFTASHHSASIANLFANSKLAPTNKLETKKNYFFRLRTRACWTRVISPTRLKVRTYTINQSQLSRIPEKLSFLLLRLKMDRTQVFAQFGLGFGGPQLGNNSLLGSSLLTPILSRESTSSPSSSSFNAEPLSSSVSLFPPPSSSPLSSSALPPPDVLRPPTVADLPSLIASILNTSETPEALLVSVRSVRKLLSVDEHSGVSDSLISTVGLLPRFVSFLSPSSSSSPSSDARRDLSSSSDHPPVDPQLQLELCWCLTNIAAGTAAHALALTSCPNALSNLVGLITDDTAEIGVKEQAAWTLGNVAGDGAARRDDVLRAGCMPALCARLMERVVPTATPSTPPAETPSVGDRDGNSRQRQPTYEFVKTAVWTLSNLCRTKPEPALEYVVDALPVLRHVLSESYKTDLVSRCGQTEVELAAVHADGLWAISYLTDTRDDVGLDVVMSGLDVPRLVAFASVTNMIESPAVCSSATRVLGNIASGDANATEKLVTAGGVAALSALLAHPNGWARKSKTTRKEAAWALSNVAAGDETQVQAVLDDELALKVMTQILGSDDEDVDLKKECFFALSNLVSGGTPNQVKTLGDTGGIASLCKVIKERERHLSRFVDVIDATVGLMPKMLIDAVNMCREEAPERDTIDTLVEWALIIKTALRDNSLLENETTQAMHDLLEGMRDALSNLVTKEPHKLLSTNDAGLTPLALFGKLAEHGGGPFAEFRNTCDEITAFLEENTSNAEIVKEGYPGVGSEAFAAAFTMMTEIC